MDKEFFMWEALKFAQQGEFTCAPNPMVGAVIVDDTNSIIGHGFHRISGGDHAEVEAFNHCKKSPRGASLFVSLEPCCSRGKTGACTQKIIDKGIKKVFIACLDPNPKHRGLGIEVLEKAGIEVEVGVLQNEAYQMNLPFYKYIVEKKPYVILKMAMSLDGKIADQKNQSKWISNSQARNYVQTLRRRSQAILIGGQTLKEDNPNLAIVGESEDTLKKFIWSRSLSKDEDFKIFSGELTSTFQADTKEEWEGFLNRCYTDDIQSILIEGGGVLAGKLLDLELVDEVCFFIAPKFILGKGSVEVCKGSIDRVLTEAINVYHQKVEVLGDDIMIRAYLKENMINPNYYL